MVSLALWLYSMNSSNSEWSSGCEDTVNTIELLYSGRSWQHTIVCESSHWHREEESFVPVGSQEVIPSCSEFEISPIAKEVWFNPSNLQLLYVDLEKTFKF